MLQFDGRVTSYPAPMSPYSSTLSARLYSAHFGLQLQPANEKSACQTATRHYMPWISSFSHGNLIPINSVTPWYHFQRFVGIHMPATSISRYPLLRSEAAHPRLLRLFGHGSHHHELLWATTTLPIGISRPEKDLLTCVIQ